MRAAYAHDQRGMESDASVQRMSLSGSSAATFQRITGASGDMLMLHGVSQAVLNGIASIMVSRVPKRPL